MACDERAKIDARLNDRPSLRDLTNHVIPKISSKWFDFGLQLGIENHKLKEIECNNPKNVRTCCREAINHWLEVTTNASWNSLIQALEMESISENTLAKDIRGSLLPEDNKQRDNHKVVEKECDLSKPSLPIVDTPDGRCVDTLSSLLQSAKGDNVSLEQNKVVSCQPQAMQDINKSQSTSAGTYFGDADLEKNKIQLADGIMIREYQKELAGPGMQGRNCIIVAPTGTGKTLVACMIIVDTLKCHKGKKVIFLVNTTPLAVQQRQKLSCYIKGAKVSCLTGESSDTLALSSLLYTSNIVVCTAQILLNDLEHKKASLENISLIVFDECHRCKGQSPYAGVMTEYLKRKLKKGLMQLPQIIGLTASPGAGDSRKPDLNKTINHLMKLGSLLDSDAGYVTVKDNEAELDQYTNKTEVSVVTICGRTSDDDFQLLLFKYIRKLDNIVQRVTGNSTFYCYTDQGYINYLSECLRQSKLRSENPEKERSICAILEHLMHYIKILHYYCDYEYEDSLLQKHKLRNPSLDTIIPVEKQLLELLQDFEKEVSSVSSTANPKLLQLKKLLLDSFQDKADSKGMIFVTEVESAYKMKEWIERQPELKHIYPGIVIGQGHGHDALKMSLAEQEYNIKCFREDKLNLLVATSVLEEGIDVPACNLVVRYQHVTNEISLVQSKGRARAAESKCYAIIGKGTIKEFQEMQNEEKNHLVNIAVKYHLPPEAKWLPKIREIQQKLLEAVEMDEMYAAKQKSNGSGEVDMLCGVCSTVICCGKEVYRNMGQYVVLSEDIKDKYTVVEHEKPRIKRDVHIRDRIHCRKCDERLGVITHWPHRRQTLPCLSCEKFAFMIKGEKIFFKKWKDVTFHVQDITDLTT